MTSQQEVATWSTDVSWAGWGGECCGGGVVGVGMGLKPRTFFSILGPVPCEASWRDERPGQDTQAP